MEQKQWEMMIALRARDKYENSQIRNMEWGGQEVAQLVAGIDMSHSSHQFSYINRMDMAMCLQELQCISLEEYDIEWKASVGKNGSRLMNNSEISPSIFIIKLL